MSRVRTNMMYVWRQTSPEYVLPNQSCYTSSVSARVLARFEVRDSSARHVTTSDIGQAALALGKLT